MSIDNFFNYDKQVKGVKGLVFLGDKLLVYRRDQNTTQFPGYLDLPGGGSEAGETPFETFCREVKEEFNLEIRRKDIIFAEKRPKKDNLTQSIYFPVAQLLESRSKDIVLGNEGSEYLLLSEEAFLSRKDVWPYFQDRAKEYFENQKFSKTKSSLIRD